MNDALRVAILPVAAALFLTGSAAAQKDRIRLTDGTVIDGVTVTGFDLRKVEFRRRGSADSRSTDLVAELEVAKVKDEYRRAYASIGTTEAPGNFLRAAEEERDPFLKQFGYVEAARLFLKNEQYAEGFQVLEELATKCPDSGYLPMLYQEKLEYYLARGREKAGDAMTVAKSYSTAAQTQGFPQGFIVEAKFYETMAEAASGGLTGDRLRSRLKTIQNEASRFENVADRCRVQIANSLRAENKIDEAQAEYEDLLERDSVPETVRAQAWLGLGHCEFAKGNPANRDPYRDALLSFLRVYIETPNAAAGTIAEALYMGKQAAEKWGGEDAGRMARALNYRLNRDYPDNPWSRR